MEGGERKEAVALPSDYVSLAQLQERWLQKQEEVKLKQKREEEEKRERDALALKQKQKGEERERDERAQNGRSWNRNRNQNQRGGAKIGGGFVRATGDFQEEGKGKEIVCGGPGFGGENNENIGKKGGRGKKRVNFKGAAAIEEREKVGAEAEVLSGEGGSGGGSSVVELVGCVSVVEVLPRNGEVAHVNGSDLIGGFNKNGRDKGSLRVNELKQSEEEESGNKCSESGEGVKKGRDGGCERGGDRVRGSEEEGGRRRGTERGGDRGKGGERWSERGGEGGRERGVDRGRSEEEGERRRGSQRGRGGWIRKNEGDPERKINMLKEYRPIISVGNEVELKLENKADRDAIPEVRSGIAILRVGDINETQGRDNRAKEVGAVGEGSNMDKVAVEIEKKEDQKVLARKGENRSSWKGYRAFEIRGHDYKAKEGGVGGEGSNGETVAMEIEKKVDHKVVSRKGENRGHGNRHRKNGIWGRENKANKDGVEGGGSKGEEVAVEIEKKVDHKVVSIKGENMGHGRGYRENERWGRENNAKEDVVEGGGSNGEEVTVEIEKKVDHKNLPRKGENRSYGRASRENGIWGRENKAKEDGVEGEGSNGEDVAVEIEKHVDHKVLPRKGENRSYGRGYRENEILKRENKAKEDVVEGGGSNAEQAAVEIDKKVDHKVLPRKGEHRGHGRGYRETEIWGRENKAKEDVVEGGGSNGEEVAVEIEKKVDHKVLPRKGENRSYGRAYQENDIWGPENKAKEDGVEEGGTNSEALAVEIEKKVDHKVLPRKGENGSFRRAYPANPNWKRAFGRGMSHSWPDRYDDFSMKPRERVLVWVKKEDKLNA